ncbi:tumor necrosis factor receptor superfamily member 14-like [Xyrichtys novacula]|nr:tumor necrosis factor receptor superfamily member 14-like [Xyrichtys novacula]
MTCVVQISAVQPLTCSWTEYQVGNKCCVMCGEGQHVKTNCKEGISTSCKPCTEGTYMNKRNGLRYCFPCTKCEEDSGLRIKRACTRTSDSVCEPVDGFYCSESGENGCLFAQKHSVCKPGHFISQNGSSVSDTVCSPCSAGSFSDGMFSSCRPHTKCEDLDLLLLEPGTESADAQCGGHHSHRTAVMASGVVVLFSVVLSALGGWCCRQRRGKYLNKGKNREAEKIEGSEKNRGAEKTGTENAEVQNHLNEKLLPDFRQITTAEEKMSSRI